MRIENPKLEWLEDPRVFSVNRTEAHSDHKFYTHLSRARLNGKMLLKQSLNGRWKFHYSKTPEQRPEQFYRDDFDYSEWDSIEVPGHIQTSGIRRASVCQLAVSVGRP